VKNALSIGVALLAIIGFSEFGQADSIVNGGFETGTLNGWSTLGDVAVIDSSFIGVTPTGGHYQAVISNGPSENPEGSPLPTSFTFSGHSSIGLFGCPPLESVLGVPTCGPSGDYFAPGTVAGVVASIYHDHSVPGSAFPINGSAMGQSFFGRAGDLLSFDFDWLTNDGGDPAVVTLDGAISLLGHGDATHHGTLFTSETGYHTFSVVVPTTGIHQLGFGVFNTFDNELSSAALIDNVTVTAVPEPSTWMLLGAGLLGITIRRHWAHRT